MPLDTFHQFPKLPTELRLRIWSYTVPEEKVIEITWNDKHSQWYAVRESAHPTYFPALANREARDNYLRKWTRFCPYHSSDPEHRADYPVCYINPKIDTLYLSAGTKEHGGRFVKEGKPWQAMLNLPCLGQIQRLCCEIMEWEMMCGRQPRPGRNREIEFFDLFPKLDVFMIVDYDMDWEWFEQRSFRRGVGTIELVEQTKAHFESPDEMWPEMVGRLNTLRKSEEFEGRVPKVEVKEILRGGTRMEYNTVAWSV